MKTKKFRITAVLIILILLMLFFWNHRKLKIEEPMGKIVLNYLFSEDSIGEDPDTLVSVDPFTGSVSPISNIGTSPVRIMGNTSTKKRKIIKFSKNKHNRKIKKIRI
mgnify:CR=1 FL=1